MADFAEIRPHNEHVATGDTQLHQVIHFAAIPHNAHACGERLCENLCTRFCFVRRSD